MKMLHWIKVHKWAIAGVVMGYALLIWVALPIVDAVDPTGAGRAVMVLSAVLVTMVYVLRVVNGKE